MVYTFVISAIRPYVTPKRLFCGTSISFCHLILKIIMMCIHTYTVILSSQASRCLMTHVKHNMNQYHIFIVENLMKSYV